MTHTPPTPESPIRSGRETAAQQQFLSLFLRSERDVFRYVSVLVPTVSDAEDIVQQTAMALWEKFDQYDPAQPFTPWACRFAQNMARQWIERRQRWKRLLDEGLAEQLLSRREALKPDLDRRLSHLDNCIRKLPERYRTIVEGYYYLRGEVDDLAESSGRTVAATYKTLQRARQTLRNCIEHAVGKEAAAR